MTVVQGDPPCRRSFPCRRTDHRVAGDGYQAVPASALPLTLLAGAALAA